MTSHSSAANSGVSSRLGPVWQGVEHENGGISHQEKEMDEITDTTKLVVNEASSSDGLIGFVKSVAADPDVKSAAKAVGKAIVDGVPGFMRLLEAVTDVHPFLKAVYLPFKQIYYQETQRRDNDQRRTELFTTLKDAILVLSELEHVDKEDTRTTPKGEPMLSRLRSICEQLERDIKECYNVVDAQKKRSIAIKFLKASSWNEKLVSYAVLFRTRREELQFAFSIKTNITVDEMNSNIKEIKETMMRMFATMLSPQEKAIEVWIKQNGGDKAVLASDKKCAELVRYEAKLAASSGQTVTLKGEEDIKKGEARAIVNLKKEYREDIQVIIKENLDSFSKGFQLGLGNLEKDLGKKIIHQGDRVIRHLNRGPHSRIKDKMIFHVWKDQGWKGSAKTRSLVLAIRDYFVERVEHEHNKLVTTERELLRPITPVPKEDEDDEDDPAADLSIPLPDNWAMGYLQVRRLHYLQQVMDPDCSGFTTVSEINAFTYARPAEWSLPRWISYWAIGWQISATKYCIQIEELFSQIFLLQKKIAMQMPGNKRYVNEYIDFTWRYVTALTSSIDRYDSPSLTLEEQFKDYVDSQEKDIKDGLEAIQYKIEDVDTLTSILHGKQIEQSVFVLLTLLMRRHLAKIHLCLKMEIDERELDDASSAIAVVINVLWARFCDLKEHFLHQRLELKQTFEWYSCGLFKNYREWDDPTNTKYFRASDMSVWTSGDTIRELDPAELAGILVYTDKPDSKSEEPPAPTVPSSPIVPVADGTSTSISTSVEPVEAVSGHEISPTPPGSSAEVSLAGTWYGWHWTETERPFREMLRLDLTCEARQAHSDASIVSGHGTISGGWPWKLRGTMTADQLLGVPKVDLERWYDDYDTRVHYLGTFLEAREIITGTFERTEPNLTFKGWFLFKKVPTSVIMCSRPFVAELDFRELWSFAYHAVVDNLRRKKLPLRYVYERMVTIRRMVELITREMDDAETMEMSRLAKDFSVEEMAEIHDLAFARSSLAKKSISGIWHGWHWTETRKPLSPMETFTLECGTLDPRYYTSISGNGVGFNSSPWTLEGLIRERRTGLTPDFTRYYDGSWTRYEGLFDVGRESISGTFENATEKGWFLLKKVAVSAIMCSRPLEVAPLAPKALRSFACQAVIDGIRRKKLTPLYLYNRMTHMRRIMELVWKHVLSDDEVPEYAELINPFSAQEILEVWKLYNWYHRVDVQHPTAFCDVCADNMHRTRVVCMECSSAEKAEDSVDLCAKLTCIGSSSLPKRKDITHLPSHLMMKIRDYFLLKDYFLFKQQATQALESAQALYKDLGENHKSPTPSIIAADTSKESDTDAPTSGGQEQATESENAAVETTTTHAPDVGVDTSPDNAKPENVPQAPDNSVLKCAVCMDRIKTPCWYCIECKVNNIEPLDTWVCDSCEKTVDYMLPWDFLKRYQAQMRTAEKHNVLHRLVRVGGGSSAEVKENGSGGADPKDSVVLPIQWERMRESMDALVSEKFVAGNSYVDKRLGEVESQLEARLKETDSRLGQVESRLEQMDSRLEQILSILTTSQAK
ncbi:hypothetical protein B0H16DRAFT_1010259 [Mycena metata]|uniref:Uncharacterized protein n=1 Tax=Mycena metata TaxID=1033252 RepID=A0AAD7N2D9_9AGAR|nr:hypothetical protein B0H16DRAFT_1010259 [Mycena metata]